MPNLKEVRNRITSVKSTQQITKAMKMVSVAKLRKAQNAIVQMRPYAQTLGGIIANLSANTDAELGAEYTTEREAKKILIVPVTSDRGLCGAFNANVVKATLALIQEKYATQAANNDITILPIGNRGRDTLTRRGMNVNPNYSTLFQNLSFAKVKDAAEFIIQNYKNGNFDRVEFVYNEFKNAATQILKVEQYLPIVKTKSDATKTIAQNNVDYLFEPSKEQIVNELIPKNLKLQLYRVVLDSNASEHGARMTAMDKATENAEQLAKDLTLVYNRSRQAAITTEILEIVAGAEALKN
ncbi:MAG: ATP synthase F1 subunit gamma [Bacteroidetes bacterium]|nr:MAG: ATP synthase F1 subunit gamma [Bacteroidota bacterium]TAG86802.1 MAG: ATP synthase F1 subunit gamma [Bacteroidota bacterium]